MPDMRRNTVPVVLAAVATALLLVVAVGAVALVSSARRDEDRAADRATQAQRTLDDLRRAAEDEKKTRDGVLSSAQTTLRTVLSYDYRSLDRYSIDVKVRSTQRFHDRFKLTVDRIRSRSALQPTASAVVRDLAVRSIDGDVARLLGFVDLAVTTVDDPGSVQRARIMLTLTRDGDDWLVDDLRTV